ncbi:MAG: hypothetical protein M1489_04920 [Firmicutes bacterium]|nr:hypothetical protein [Bacillota bacterium]
MEKFALEPLLDPRGRQERPQLKLAPRVNMEDLQKGRILFYNNTKLEFCNYTEIFPRIKKLFADRGIKNFIDFRETVRGKSTQDLINYAKKLAAAKPVAAVVALGDMGTSAATTVITIAFEELGIPSVYITAPPGAQIVEGVAFYRAGRLCLCPIDIYQASTKEEVMAQVDSQFDCILESLTLPPEKIDGRAKLDFKLDQVAPAENGLLPIMEKLAVAEEKLREPGSYMEEIMDYFNGEYLGDGLPIIPPTQSRYEKMLTYCPYAPEEVLAREIGPSGKNITVRDVAVAAVMAGCKPGYMPILVTAFKAMANPKYNFLQSVTTSHPGGNLVLVSGPLAQELGIHGGQGCLGPGFVANATIGRAVNLAIINVCRAVPGVCDLDCLASQAEFTYCFAEDPGLTPWTTINEECYDKDTTTVLVLKAEPPHDIIDFLSLNGGDLLDTITDSCTTLGSNNAYIPGNLILVVTPDHAKMLHRDGYDKNRIREHIHRYAYHQAPMVRNRGLVPVRPPGFDEMHPIPVTRSPRDIEIVVAGGRGGHSEVILPWALHSEAIVEPVLLPDGKIARSIKEFKR